MKSPQQVIVDLISAEFVELQQFPDEKEREFQVIQFLSELPVARRAIIWKEMEFYVNKSVDVLENYFVNIMQPSLYSGEFLTDWQKQVCEQLAQKPFEAPVELLLYAYSEIKARNDNAQMQAVSQLFEYAKKMQNARFANILLIKQAELMINTTPQFQQERTADLMPSYLDKSQVVKTGGVFPPVVPEQKIWTEIGKNFNQDDKKTEFFSKMQNVLGLVRLDEDEITHQLALSLDNYNFWLMASGQFGTDPESIKSYFVNVILNQKSQITDYPTENISAQACMKNIIQQNPILSGIDFDDLVESQIMSTYQPSTQKEEESDMFQITPASSIDNQQPVANIRIVNRTRWTVRFEVVRNPANVKVKQQLQLTEDAIESIHSFVKNNKVLSTNDCVRIISQMLENKYSRKTIYDVVRQIKITLKYGKHNHQLE
ncbi:Hypothetical_protein [Hexamita inflata]|uniref:Hypothetical_protein n=1 Tax=Hexamita inflata TaxID=28002 RepID=A0AA86QK13_9EUKA|nr:Hypothetical protein HINF_LOCUS47735 [Hexamita inflata]CAI9972914.1 Hypothetical protein HINF_LOCUS60559 [Hexamita inflata]